MTRHIAFAVALAISIAVALLFSLPFIMGECFGSDAERLACLEEARRSFGAYFLTLLAAIGVAIVAHVRAGRMPIFMSLMAVALGPFLVAAIVERI